MAMYEVGTVTGAASQARVTGATTKWSQEALGILPGSILVVYRSGSADLYAIKSVDSDTQLTLTRNITTAFSGASYGIITAETASTSSFANQLASAFAFWRSVVEGWSMALTGSGNITLTDPITGKQVTVPAIAGMAKASDLNALAKLTGGN
ncbi:tail fiber domain-containing protein, partial [Klebsiella pneumoniae]|nr:tail fiber domain-containing protein [Klebsiella pneumoniae]MBL2826949.1 tail fiber domain-containing protein [Klebsiella pneumoniae]MBL2872435.1 tail fiber domain-containing protein [Klebsiella pneumoniae]MBL2883638.1 tail fiber domain-containing protein [Klebsiella pneumoniae]MBL2906367.1 tail fiber domain-containing protein [Klebsiella pneumoniae]